MDLLIREVAEVRVGVAGEPVVAEVVPREAGNGLYFETRARTLIPAFQAVPGIFSDNL